MDDRCFSQAAAMEPINAIRILFGQRLPTGHTVLPPAQEEALRVFAENSTDAKDLAAVCCAERAAAAAEQRQRELLLWKRYVRERKRGLLRYWTSPCTIELTLVRFRPQWTFFTWVWLFTLPGVCVFAAAAFGIATGSDNACVRFARASPWSALFGLNRTVCFMLATQLMGAMVPCLDGLVEERMYAEVLFPYPRKAYDINDL